MSNPQSAIRNPKSEISMLLGEPAPSPADLHFRLFGIPVRVSPWFWVVSLLLGMGGRAGRSGQHADLGGRRLRFHPGPRVGPRVHAALLRRESVDHALQLRRPGVVQRLRPFAAEPDSHFAGRAGAGFLARGA